MYIDKNNNQADHVRAFFLALFAITLIIVTGFPCHAAVVVDSLTKSPLPSASVFNGKGKVIGICNSRGRLPYISKSDYPLTVRYMGFDEGIVPDAQTDTVFLRENPTELAEFVVEGRQQKVMHMLAYVREYSTLTTYTDTVFLFREKMVDFMLSPDPKVKFRGWSYPRILKSKSYYRFTNAHGLDSVSDKCNHHFSWSDWMGVNAQPRVPASLRSVEVSTDTIYGKYSPTEVWLKNNDHFSIDVNVLADTTSRKWVPNLAGFFHQKLDYENFRVRFNYDNIVDNAISPMDLTGYSFNIESNGRGHNMFRFNRHDEPFFVSTYGEVYIMDKEFITLKEARKWEKHKFSDDDIELMVAPEAPELQPYILGLMARVDNIDRDAVRLDVEPDRQLVNPRYGKNRNYGLGMRALNILKTVTGIYSYKTRKNNNRNWNNFRDAQKQRNKSNHSEASDSHSNTPQ